MDPGLRGSRETIKIVAWDLSRMRLASYTAHAGIGWNPLSVSRILGTHMYRVLIPQSFYREKKTDLPRGRMTQGGTIK